jgi:hypothetical protein
MTDETKKEIERAASDAARIHAEVRDENAVWVDDEKYSSFLACAAYGYELRVAEVEAKLRIATTALEKIAEQYTLYGEKYLSYEQGWHGVSEFARQALAEMKGRSEID